LFKCPQYSLCRWGQSVPRTPELPDRQLQSGGLLLSCLCTRPRAMECRCSGCEKQPCCMYICVT
jgi:hypothetical protein